MRLEVSIIATVSYDNKPVQVTLSEEVIGGGFDTPAAAAAIRDAVDVLVPDAVARAQKQIAARVMLAETEAVA